MPNWCECDLYISGPKEELEKFLETVKSEESVFDFNRVIPGVLQRVTEQLGSLLSAHLAGNFSELRAGYLCLSLMQCGASNGLIPPIPRP